MFSTEQEKQNALGLPPSLNVAGPWDFFRRGAETLSFSEISLRLCASAGIPHSAPECHSNIARTAASRKPVTRFPYLVAAPELAT